MIKSKNIFAIIFLILFFGIPLWLTANAHEAAVNKTLSETAAIIDKNPVSINVASHTCHHLLPNALHKVMNPLLCWSCGDMAQKLREDFVIFNPNESCKGRGQVALLFTHH